MPPLLHFEIKSRFLQGDFIFPKSWEFPVLHVPKHKILRAWKSNSVMQGQIQKLICLQSKSTRWDDIQGEAEHIHIFTDIEQKLQQCEKKIVLRLMFFIELDSHRYYISLCSTPFHLLYPSVHFDWTAACNNILGRADSSQQSKRTHSTGKCLQLTS